GGLNSFFNELAYKPKGSRQSYLFYLPWINHNVNASFNLADAAGPVQRGLITITCTGSYLGYALGNGKPFLKALLLGANLPRANELPPIKGTPAIPSGCGPGVEP